MKVTYEWTTRYLETRGHGIHGARQGAPVRHGGRDPNGHQGQASTAEAYLQAASTRYVHMYSVPLYVHIGTLGSDPRPCHPRVLRQSCVR